MKYGKRLTTHQGHQFCINPAIIDSMAADKPMRRLEVWSPETSDPRMLRQLRQYPPQTSTAPAPRGCLLL